MQTEKAVPASVDDYVAGFAPDVREVLERIRATVRGAAPDAREAIKYGMPAYLLEGSLVYFAAFNKHVGFFCTTTGGGVLADEMAPYAGPKGSLRFPFGKPVPYDLIERIVRFRVDENRAAAAAKPKKK
ncbi:iron chaperone [Longimicrobium sp.]|uniref:iron chaperone n=1 Tax=Longimicrobium sp. TaxID=2029185 RepID=UPI002E3598AD|nr:DUF1801 domain-containing protein [Longimicrobium sp.]HEX6041766.1 DUF1801 domain-containing protein [Longimicrobium sp.]